MRWTHWGRYSDVKKPTECQTVGAQIGARSSKPNSKIGASLQKGNVSGGSGHGHHQTFPCEEGHGCCNRLGVPTEQKIAGPTRRQPMILDRSSKQKRLQDLAGVLSALYYFKNGATHKRGLTFRDGEGRK